MTKCTVCDAELQPEQKTCHVCGSHVEAAVTTGTISPSVVSLPPLPPLPTVADSVVASSASNITGERECPACGQSFGSDFQDEFCPCGTELVAKAASSREASASGPNTASPAPVAVASAPTAPSGSVRPAVGTVCLVLYSDTKPRQPVRYFPIMKDVVLIGRQDAVRGDFPDLDLNAMLDESLSRKVSRRHAEVLRARDTQTYRLRPLPGNTGTQLGKELASAGQDYPLADGTPIVLGGAVWMKFETIK